MRAGASGQRRTVNYATTRTGYGMLVLWQGGLCLAGNIGGGVIFVSVRGRDVLS